ncbi:hypothetical protein [Hymenobacter rubripertinctus]|uniref:Uncharacterized protein n=1 Tax=Hymenobacter rubripertinctus TaxID=2029981 RepID=A0A418R7H2_9BACT|nr:hypothetical protein [Hymenobacter rubripertinctus]RIY13413.1 hypothetical protein D0T11_02960 [Hymenobacter rubripertinctus]
MKHYLRLRLRLLARQVRELGWARLLALGALLVLVLGKGLVTAATRPGLAWVVPGAVGLLVLSHHRRRSDLAFLHLTTPEFRGWLAAEYALAGLLPALVVLGLGQPGPALLTVVGAAAAALVPAAAAPVSKRRRPGLFRSVAFEWVSAGRRPGLGLAWLGLLAAAGATREGSTGPALAVVGWLLPALGRPGPWLRGRVGWALLYFGLTVAPLAAVLAGGMAGAGGAAALLLWCALVLTMVVLAKYAFYPHATLGRLTQAGAVGVGLSILGSNPAYLALLLACFLGLLVKSRRRLAQYRPE